ncbi:WEB family protein [Spatholobus suberectus]|nr:WEB family protein [Spatholobus suberectus]
MLDEARHEIDVLVCSIENSKSAFENSKAEWEQRELHLVSCLKKDEEEKVSLEKEIKDCFICLKKLRMKLMPTRRKKLS